MRGVWFLTVTGALLSLLGTAVAGERITVAEFRADRDLAPRRAPLSPVWTTDAYTVEETQISHSATDPLLLTNRELGGTVQRAIVTGYPTLSAVFDYRYQQAHWGDKPYRFSQSFRFGPSYSASTGTVTRLYYGVAQDYVARDIGLSGASGDVERLSTGLAQTWYLGERDTELHLGYEYEQGTSEDSYERMQGHRINVGGSFPLAWGFNADVAAGYSRYSYPEPNGSLELQSDRLSLKAGISRTFTTRLSGSLRYNYADEEFDDAPFSNRRHTWGLNFRFRY